MSDTEEFCPRCAAGTASDEHHTKCVALGWAIDGEPAPEDAPSYWKAPEARPAATWQQAARDAGLAMRRVWFHRPQIWWPRWTPVWIGHDEYARRTLVVGWTFTGQVIIALGYCGDPECITERDRMIRDFAEEPW